MTMTNFTILLKVVKR